MLLKANKGYVNEIKEDMGVDWFLTCTCQNGEVSLVAVHDLKTNQLLELGNTRLEKCIFVPPKEYLELIEELEAIRDNGLPWDADDYNNMDKVEQQTWDRAWESAINASLQLIAQRANPPPGVI